MRVKVIALLSLLICLGSCRSIKETKALQDCKYTFLSITDIIVNGITLDGKTSLKDFNTHETVKISQAMLKGSLPIELTANVQIENPSSKTATLNKLDWELVIKEKTVATGCLDEFHKIAPGKSIELPIEIETDAAKVLKAVTIKNLMEMMFNVSDPEKLIENAKLRVRPSFEVGKKGKVISSPAFFSIGF